VKPITIAIGSKTISPEGPPFLIAEAGVNYFDIAREKGVTPLEAARLMISQAAGAGADAIKFQTYKADRLAVRDSAAYWDTAQEACPTQHELFSRYDKLGRADYRKLADYAREKGIIFMSTPFDAEAVDYLDELMPAFKIASADITNIPLIKRIAAKKKPVLLSTGAATLEEIKAALSAIQNEGNNRIVIMHCVLNYPTQYQRANLLAIRSLGQAFPEHPVGYSDHTLPDPQMLVLTSAYLLGARVLEKHFTLDKRLPGNDHYHAMDPDDLRKAVRNLKLAREISGDGARNLESELPARRYARRSLVARVDIARGTRLTESLITGKRPGTGISPALLDLVIGRTAKRDIKADEILSWDDIR
jgi:sialic acid synthase SpsE